MRRHRRGNGKPAIVGFETSKSFGQPLKTGAIRLIGLSYRCRAAHAGITGLEASKSFRKTAIDGRNSPPYMAVSPTGHGFLAYLVCVISIGNPVPRIITGIRWRVGSLTLLVR